MPADDSSTETTPLQVVAGTNYFVKAEQLEVVGMADRPYGGWVDNGSGWLMLG